MRTGLFSLSGVILALVSLTGCGSSSRLHDNVGDVKPEVAAKIARMRDYDVHYAWVNRTAEWAVEDEEGERLVETHRLPDEVQPLRNHELPQPVILRNEGAIQNLNVYLIRPEDAKAFPQARPIQPNDLPRDEDGLALPRMDMPLDGDERLP